MRFRRRSGPRRRIGFVEFVREVLDAVADGDDEAARELVAGLHPADIADLIELAPGDERGDLIEALAGMVDADVYAELNEYVREDVIDEMEPQQVADLAAQLDTDDAVALIEDLEQDDQLAVLRARSDRAAVESLTYGERRLVA
jgi:magnesium transporter